MTGRCSSSCVRGYAPRGSGEEGFILALGLLLLAALALIGTAALSNSSFQKDLTGNVRQNQEVYYGATVGLGEALEKLSYLKPRLNAMTVRNTEGAFSGEPYLVGSYDRRTGVLLGTEGCRWDDRACLCPDDVEGNMNTISFYVEVVLKNVGNAPPRWGIDQYRTWYWQVTSTATGCRYGNQSQVSVYVAAVYPLEYGSGGSGGGG